MISPRTSDFAQITPRQQSRFLPHSHSHRAVTALWCQSQLCPAFDSLLPSHHFWHPIAFPALRRTALHTSALLQFRCSLLCPTSCTLMPSTFLVGSFQPPARITFFFFFLSPALRGTPKYVVPGALLCTHFSIGFLRWSFLFFFFFFILLSFYFSTCLFFALSFFHSFSLSFPIIIIIGLILFLSGYIIRSYSFHSKYSASAIYIWPSTPGLSFTPLPFSSQTWSFWPVDLIYVWWVIFPIRQSSKTIICDGAVRANDRRDW